MPSINLLDGNDGILEQFKHGPLIKLHNERAVSRCSKSEFFAEIRDFRKTVNAGKRVNFIPPRSACKNYSTDADHACEWIYLGIIKSIKKNRDDYKKKCRYWSNYYGIEKVMEKRRLIFFMKSPGFLQCCKKIAFEN